MKQLTDELYARVVFALNNGADEEQATEIVQQLSESQAAPVVQEPFGYHWRKKWVWGFSRANDFNAVSVDQFTAVYLAAGAAPKERYPDHLNIMSTLQAAPTVQPLSDTELINRGCRYETELTAPTVQDSDALSVREIVLMNERYAHAKKMQKEQTP